MEKRLSYIVVGIFVIVITLSLFMFLFWLAKYGNKTVEHDYYKTYFTESVSGLNAESLVKLRGVEVGRVKKISINKNNSEEVEVLLEITKDTPIKQDTYTMLDSQGITGLKYIELKGGHNVSAQLKSTKDKILTIPSHQSVMSHLFNSSGSITDKANHILDKISVVLSDKNIQNISEIIDNLSTTTTYINENKHKIDELLAQVNNFLEHTKKFENELLIPIQKVGDMSDKAGIASDSTNDFFVGMNKELNNGEFSVADIVEDNLQILNEAVLSLKSLSLKLEETVDSLKESPSDLLYKSNKKILGPGESHD
jgi:phospholipid/cholesterol/gamma-HCH transport system substrate-binding protein